MVRPKKEEVIESVNVAPKISEKEQIIDWLRHPEICRFERNTRWLADKIAEGEHLK